MPAPQSRSLFISVAVIKHSPKQFKEGRSLLQFRGYSLLLREDWAGTWAGTVRNTACWLAQIHVYIYKHEYIYL